MANSESKFEKIHRIDSWPWSSDSIQKTSKWNSSGDAFDVKGIEPVVRLTTKWELNNSVIFFGGEETVPSTLNKSSGSQWGFDDDSSRNPQFQPSNVFLPERWESNFSLDARVYQLDNASVYCDCLVDPDEQQFEKRVYPRQLFEHLFELKVGSLVVIKIRSKKGAMRIDVTDGRGIVSPEIFEMESRWDSLKGF